MVRASRSHAIPTRDEDRPFVSSPIRTVGQVCAIIEKKSDSTSPVLHEERIFRYRVTSLLESFRARTPATPSRDAVWVVDVGQRLSPESAFQSTGFGGDRVVGAIKFEPAAVESNLWASDRRRNRVALTCVHFLFPVFAASSAPCTLGPDPTHPRVTSECCLRAVLGTKPDHQRQLPNPMIRL